MSNMELRDFWESKDAHRIVQSDPSSDSEVDGKIILAKARGPAFFPDSESGNGVYYSRQAWENAINHPDFVKKLDERLILGSIGHDIVMDDISVRDSKFSHVLTNVFIDESNVGQAEYLIFNTPPGQALNMLLRAKSKIKVSTKAKGRTLADVSVRREVDPDLFFLERIDFVLDPGYPHAGADLVEALLNHEKNVLTEEETMTNAATEKLIQVQEARILELSNEKKITSDIAESMTSEVDAIRRSAKYNDDRIAALELELKKAYDSLSEYKTTISDQMDAYAKLGAVSEIYESMEKSSKLADEHEVLKCEYKQVLEASVSLEEALVAYQEFGTVLDINEMLKAADLLADNHIDIQIKELSESSKVSNNSLMMLKEKGLSLDEIKEFAESVTIKAPRDGNEDFSEKASSKNIFSRANSKDEEPRQINESKKISSLASKLLSCAK